MSAVDEVDTVIASVERLLNDAAEKATTDPIHTRAQIKAAINQLHAVKGFLL